MPAPNYRGYKGFVEKLSRKLEFPVKDLEPVVKLAREVWEISGIIRNYYPKSITLNAGDPKYGPIIVGFYSSKLNGITENLHVFRLQLILGTNEVRHDIPLDERLAGKFLEMLQERGYKPKAAYLPENNPIGFARYYDK